MKRARQATKEDSSFGLPSKRTKVGVTGAPKVKVIASARDQAIERLCEEKTSLSFKDAHWV